MNNEILCTSTPCYHIASLNCDDLSNCVARWQQRFIPRCKHSNNDNTLAAGTTFVGSKLLFLHIVSPESNDKRQGGNERERPISSHIASRDGNDFNAIYHIVSHGGDYDNASRNCGDFDVYHIVSHGGDYDNDYDDFNRIDFIFIASRNGDSNNNGCGNNICYPPAPRLSTTCRVKATTKRTRYCVTHGNDSS